MQEKKGKQESKTGRGRDRCTPEDLLQHLDTAMPDANPASAYPWHVRDFLLCLLQFNLEFCSL